MTPRDYALEIEACTSPHEIEIWVHKIMAEAQSVAAMEIDDADRKGNIRYPGDASTICRRLAEEHLSQT